MATSVDTLKGGRTAPCWKRCLPRNIENATSPPQGSTFLYLLVPFRNEEKESVDGACFVLFFQRNVTEAEEKGLRHYETKQGLIEASVAVQRESNEPIRRVLCDGGVRVRALATQSASTGAIASP